MNETTGPVRISAEEARKKSVSGAALLVCAYDSDEKCRAMHLEGALFLSGFRNVADSLPKDRELIFYCA
jgi:hypothetical protein